MTALYFPNKTTTTVSVALNPTSAEITRKEDSPVGQSIEIAASGRDYARATSTNVQEVWYMDVKELQETDATPFDSWTTLKSFIQLTLNYMMNTFELEDTDGDLLLARYVRGLPSIIESGGQRNPRGRRYHFSGTLVFRKVL